MKIYYVTTLFLILLGAVLGCNKSYTLAPVPVPPTPTFTNTPCGYPGNTCTWTFTPTNTNTFTPTNTLTPTFTPTPTPAPLNTPQGVLGWLDFSTDYPNVVWVSDPSSAVTAYQVWVSNSSSGPFSCGLTIAKGVDTTDIVDSVTSFNIYIYIVAVGTQPNSANSVTVHAVSGTTTTQGLGISESASTTPLTSVSGTIAGSAYRTYQFVATYPSVYWFWDDLGATSSSVPYNASGGLNYVSASAIPGSATNIPVTVRTYNNQYWNIDASWTTFTP